MGGSRPAIEVGILAVLPTAVPFFPFASHVPCGAHIAGRRHICMSLDLIAMIWAIAKMPGVCEPNLSVTNFVFSRVMFVSNFPVPKKGWKFLLSTVIGAGGECISFGRWGLAFLDGCKLSSNVVTYRKRGAVEVALAFIYYFVVLDDASLHEIIRATIGELRLSPVIVKYLLDFTDAACPFVGLEDTAVGGEGVEQLLS
jgi:hypothetical protein